MPYIHNDKKIKLASATNGIRASFKDQEITPGELNYLFTYIAQAYLATSGTKYTTINDVLGALDGASKEFYRRVAVPYETKKIKENGDVY